MKTNRSYYLPVLILGALTVAISARADIITINFVSSPLAGSPDDMLTFQGILTNNAGADLWINGVSINLAGFDPSDVDPTDFILNATGLLPDGSSIGPVDFFTVTIPDSFPTGPYTGVMTVQGGATADDDAVLGAANFEADVNPTEISTPELNSFLLILTAAMVIALKWYLCAVIQSFRARPPSSVDAQV